MPIFKGSSSKSSPKKAITYILDNKKASLVDSFYLDDCRSYAEQFQETAKLWDKAKNKDSRKYYHFKLSFDVADNQRGLTSQKVMDMARELTIKSFPSSECVLAVHTDTEHLHAHIIVNSVCFDNGKMLQISPQKYTKLKDLANTISERHGFSTVDFRKPSKIRQSTAERQIIAKGKTSWKEELREVIDLAKRETYNIVDFEKYLNKYGITLTRNTSKSISYLHPDKKQAIRGERLGADYTKGAILNEFNKQRNRSSSWKQTGTVSTERVRINSDNNSTTDGNQRTIDIIDELERRKQKTSSNDRATELTNIEVERRKREQSQQDYELQQVEQRKTRLAEETPPKRTRKQDFSL